MKKKFRLACISIVIIFVLFPCITFTEKFNCNSTDCPTGRERPWCTGDYAWITYTTYYYWWGYEEHCGLECYSESGPTGGLRKNFSVNLT